MRSYFSLKKFKRWKKDNRKRFLHPPYLTRIRPHGFSLGFTGLDPRIQGYINQNGSVSVGVNYRGDNVDTIAEFDVLPERDSGGNFFCSFCRDSNPVSELYPSRLELVRTHAWENLLEWINLKCTTTTWVCVYGESGAYSEVKLKDEHEVDLERQKEDFWGAFPMILRKKPRFDGIQE